MGRTRLLAVSAAALLAAVAFGLPQAGASLTAPPGVRTVTPNATDPAIGLPNAAHHVVLPTGTPRGRLFVFLPGSGASPLGYDDVVLEAGAQGYHAIGLSYPNATTAASKCGNDLDCYGPLHQRVFDGTGSSAVDSTTPVNAVEHRLAALLTYLDASYPTEGWGQYVSGGLPVWSKVVLAGHSQGASEAAWGGEVRDLAGVVLFAGPADADSNDVPAHWLSDPHLTPAERYVALIHSKDNWYARDAQTWVALGIPGARQMEPVDGGVVAGADTHAFVTSGKPRGIGLFVNHDEPVVDDVTPLCSSGPALAPVWDAMLALAAGGTGVPVKPAC